MKKLAGKFFIFASVGVIGTIVHYTALIIVVDGFHATPVFGSSVGFVLGAFVNYALNRRYTFRSQKKHIDAMPRFYLIAAAGFGLNGGIVFLLTEIIDMHYLLAQIAATGVVLLWNFTGNHLWTFANERA